MGRNNQQRRADKKRRAQRHGRADRRWEPDEIVARHHVQHLVVNGAEAAARKDAAQLDEAVEALVGAAEIVGVGLVADAAGSTFASVLAALWEAGWQAAELVHQVRRRHREAHTALVVAALAAPRTWELSRGAAMPDAWAAQLATLGAPTDVARPDWLLGAAPRSSASFDGVVRTAMEALGALIDLPVMDALLPRPSGWSLVGTGGPAGAADDAVLAKVRSLLAKAESTAFEPEAEALTAKAQELMSRHSLDDAVARSAAAVGEAPATRRVLLEDPYTDPKASLLEEVAAANGARCVRYPGLAISAVVGFAGDLDGVELLFTSLLVQASRAMLAKGSTTDFLGRSSTRSYRQSFLLAFAHRIGERLALAAVSARTTAEMGAPGSLLPVLAARDQQVDDAVETAFPHLRVTGPATITNRDGWQAGRIAAELATLGPVQQALAG